MRKMEWTKLPQIDKAFYHQSITDAIDADDYVNNENDAENAFQSLLGLPVVFQSLPIIYTEIDDDCCSHD